MPASLPALRRSEPPLSLVVVAGLVVGALVMWAAIGVRELGASARATVTGSEADATDWTREGWPVDPARPWEGAVVRISTTRCGDEIRGSGVVVDGAVLTNRHVVDDAAEVVVTTADGTAHRARSLAVSDHVDLASIGLDDLDVPDASWATGQLAVPARGLTLVGFPNGHRFSTREVGATGTLHGWGYPDPDQAVHLDHDVVPGESGSALVDARGRVAGLLYARAISDGNGLVIGASDARSEVRRLTSTAFVAC